MQVETNCFALGDFETNCYVLRSGHSAKKCLVIDVGFSAGPLLDFLEAEDLEPQRILLTHGHCDHVAGIPLLHERFGPVPVCIGTDDGAMLTDSNLNLSSLMAAPLNLAAADELLKPGGIIEYEEIRLAILPTPGHTPGGLSFYCEADAAVFAGDSLFAGSIGRADFPGGSEKTLLESIRKELLGLPDETKVYPGHGPATTVGAEKRTNPFFQGSVWR